MIETLIRRSDRRTHHLNAPLLAEREQFLSNLLTQGVSENQVRTIAAELLNVIRIMGLEGMRMVGESEIEDATQRWLLDELVLRPCAPTRNSGDKFRRAATKWLRFHNRILPATNETGPFGGVMLQYAVYLDGRIAKETSRSYVRIVRNFLRFAEQRQPFLGSLTVADVSGYLDAQRQAGNCLGTIAAHCQAIRTFLRYCKSNAIALQLRADQVRSPRVRRYDPHPRGPRWRDVRRLLRIGADANLADIRARAILFLCSIYAMRASEVTNLKMSDFDWVGEEFTVRRAKGGGVQRFPIQFEVGEAILKYIRFARPNCSCRTLFVSLNPPYRPLIASTIRVLVERRMQRLNIRSVTRGPHALRHACATELLSKGVSVREIADFLGHNGVESVSVYAKCSLRALREVAEFPLEALK